MAQIVERIVGDRCLQLGNEEFVRPMAIGQNWSRIRIALRYLMGGAGIVSPRISVGVCSGTTNTYSSSSCVGWVGGSWPSINGDSPTYSGTPNYWYQYAFGYGGTGGWSGTKKIGSSVTDTVSINGSAPYYMAAVGGLKTSFLNIDITRSTVDATAYIIRCAHTDSTKVTVGQNAYQFLQTIEDEGLANFGSTYATYATTTVTHTGLPFGMDTISVKWSHSVPTFEIYDLAVLRYA